MSPGRDGSWIRVAAAVVTLFLLEAVGFAQAKVKHAAPHQMDTLMNIQRLDGDHHVPFAFGGRDNVIHLLI